ncbi:hypothetical protein ILYODFUR_000041 [Ilyodon furcidens]|uniref:Uncharacterized protein n=1 Tax=Ilyodon furcidens TaxID=33524 RepID=A0ABV0UMQ1_9TELE
MGPVRLPFGLGSLCLPADVSESHTCSGAFKQTTAIRHSSRYARSVGTRPWFWSNSPQTAMLHTTFVDVCMHVHVSCHPASHQLLMRPAGSLLGPNQTGDGTDLALSDLYTPPPRSPTPTLPCLPDILENHCSLSMRDRFGNGQGVCVKSPPSPLSRALNPKVQKVCNSRPASKREWTRGNTLTGSVAGGFD